MTWNPEQQLKFAEPRLRPAVDLLTSIDAANPARVFDLGCGAGNVRRLLKARWPDAQTTGVDDSEAMLTRAAKSLDGVSWVQQSLADWQPERAADSIPTPRCTGCLTTAHYLKSSSIILHRAVCSPCKCREISARRRTP